MSSESEKTFRITFVPRVEPPEPICCEYIKSFNTYDEAKIVLDNIADYTLMLHDNYLMSDYSNCGYIEQYVNGEWIEVEDED